VNKVSDNNKECVGLELALSDLINEAISSRLFPGCSIAIWSNRIRQPIVRAWGRLTYVPWSPEVTSDTWFDLASLTKPIATAISVATLVAEKKLSIQTQVKDIFPEAQNFPVGDVTVSSLLSHSSGLFPHIYFHHNLLGFPERERKKALFMLFLEEKLHPGHQTYSDLGFLLLGLILERICDASLYEIACERVFVPFGLSNSFFFGSPQLLIEGQMAGWETVAPTGFCPVRNRLVWAEVNDLNSWALGGITGHAGLFSTAKAIALLMQQLLELYKGRRKKVGQLDCDTVRFFFRRVSEQQGEDWALGFDTPSEVGSSAGILFSHESIGHLGFTGTSFWVDLKQEVIVVFLCNRTFPVAERIDNQSQMKLFRPALHNLVMNWLHQAGLM